MNGHDLGAHDTLARVVSVSIENFHDGPNGNCNPGPVSHVRKRKIKNSIKGSLRDSLPLALNAAFMSGALREPGLAEGNVQNWRFCDTDADCDFRAPGGPAFEIPPRRGYPAVWRGARHVCRLSPDSDVCPPGDPDCSFCAAQLEIDRINVRPDGLEVVIEDDVDLDVDPQDPQVSSELFSNPLARGQVCDVARVNASTGRWEFFPRPGGGYLRSDLPPDPHVWGGFRFTIATTTGTGSSAMLPIPTCGCQPPTRAKRRTLVKGRSGAKWGVKSAAAAVTLARIWNPLCPPGARCAPEQIKHLRQWLNSV